MKTRTITKTVEVTISNRALLAFFVQAVADDARCSVGKHRTFYRALGHLIGINDIDAVKIANDNVKKEDRITTKEFRQWLPHMFARFAQAVLEETE